MMKPGWLQVERINAEARELHPVRVLLTIIAGVFFALGWVTAKVAMTVWFVIAWLFAAVRLGWRDARGRPAPPPSSSSSSGAWVEVE